MSNSRAHQDSAMTGSSLSEGIFQDSAADQEEEALIANVDDRAGTSTRISNSERVNLFVGILTASAALSGLLFGYDTGIISAALLSLSNGVVKDDSPSFPLGRPLTVWDKSIITSVTSATALFASPLGGLFADARGRKQAIFVADLLFIAGALLQAFGHNVVGMVWGRAIVGIAIGGASAVAPLYISELAPATFRGRLVTISVLFITGGQVIAYVVGWLLSSADQGWRWMLGLGALPALCQLLSIYFMPETPRWLFKVGRKTEAKNVLGKIYSADPSARTTLESIIRGLAAEVQEEEVRRHEQLGKLKSRSPFLVHLHRLKDTLSDLMVPGNRRSLAIACMLQGLQQACGFNSVMYFSGTIFALVGFHSPTLISLTVAGTNMLFTIIAFLVIDSIGRRRILLLSIPFMAVGLVLAAFAFHYIDIQIGSSATTPKLFTRVDYSEAWQSMLLVPALMLFVAAYALGVGNVPWHQSELFPLRVRSLGSGFATATNWTFNTLVAATFLPMMQSVGASTSFSFYALVCLGGWVAVWKIYPEAMGVGLESIGALLRPEAGQESMTTEEQQPLHEDVNDSMSDTE